MSQPYGFSWIEKPFLAASAMPHDETELAWLRDQGIDIVLTLTEQALPRKWIDNQGLMNVHVPIEDMTVPTTEDIEKCLRVIQKARDSNMGIMVHCLAGKGAPARFWLSTWSPKGCRGTMPSTIFECSVPAR